LTLGAAIAVIGSQYGQSGGLSITSQVIDLMMWPTHTRCTDDKSEREAKESQMTDYRAVATRYIACWNETDPVARRAIIEETWAPDGRYIDPIANVQGLDEIDATIAAVQSQFPSFVFRLVGSVDGHGNQCRFAWELGPETDDSPVAGFDVAVLSPEGRIQTVLGFLDRVPSAA
jgi:SnoaL-like domain